MDPEDLRDEVDEWVGEGIITEAQAAEIRSKYEHTDTGRSRAVVALSIVGAALVFVGITLFLANNWHDLPVSARAGILLASPSLAYLAGLIGYRRNAVRIGHALVILGAVLIGPSLFLLEDLFDVVISDVWLFFGWAAVALPTGHFLDSRPGTGFGLLVLAVSVIELGDPADPAPILGLFGIILVAIGYTRDGRAAWTYQLVGTAMTIVALLLLTTWEGRFTRFELELTTLHIIGFLGALVGTWWLYGSGKRSESGWVIVGVAGLGLSVTMATLAPETVPELVGFLGTHVATLLVLMATGYLGYRTRSQSLIDLAALGALLQTLSFVAATIVDALSGSIALIVAGLILLIIGVGLERGRRSILAQLD